MKRPRWITRWVSAERARRARIHRECRALLAQLSPRERLEVSAAALASLAYGRTPRESLTEARRRARRHGKRNRRSG